MITTGPADETARLQERIDRLAHTGGGRVALEPGRHLCGTLHLRPGVGLHLERGAILEASPDPSLYPVIAPTANLPGQIQALVWAEKADGTGLSGEGVIDGGGASPMTWEEARRQTFRPALVLFRGCHDVDVSGLTLRHATYWTLHLQRCTRVRTSGLRIYNHRPNGDGIDPDGCRDVVISDCLIETGDDCIVLKSTEGEPCENIAITNCVLRTRCAAIKLGTESIGPIRRVVASNCVIDRTEVALALYMKDGAAYEDILFQNIVIESDAAFPIVVDATPRAGPGSGQPAGRIRRVSFDHLQVVGPGRIHLEGQPGEPLEGIRFRDVSWHLTGTPDFASARKPAGAARVRAGTAPAVLPATHPHHLVAVHVDGLSVDGLRLTQAHHGPGDRGVAWLENSPGARLFNLVHPTPPSGLPAVATAAGSEPSPR